ncbi:IMPACT family protein [Marinicella meishanensis]|uniref:IMPACT family protein n=1 Tax=Marinicella meishanensis TaxID=2873263 RepID=UPI001CBAA199|nr:YigZ family protein [Marinicella sp. NBU2979]
MTNKVITQTHTNEAVIKKSLFIGVCGPVDSPTDFFHFLEQHQDLNATHNCWAYRIGSEYRFNDDGEPSGTAGKPILAAIDGAGFDCIGALVIRHYGGIKLGTGGLARAYGGTIAKNLQQAPCAHHVPMDTSQVLVPFACSQPLFKLVSDLGGAVISQEFQATGVQCVVSIPTSASKPFKQNVQNLSKGQAVFAD